MTFPGNPFYTPARSVQEVTERTDEVVHIVAGVYTDPDDTVKYTVKVMAQVEPLSLESLKHIRHLCAVP